LHVGADYLRETLAAEPATPADLAERIRSLSHSYQELTLISLAGEPASAEDPARHTIDTDMTHLDRLCK